MDVDGIGQCPGADLVYFFIHGEEKLGIFFFQAIGEASFSGGMEVVGEQAGFLPVVGIFAGKEGVLWCDAEYACSLVCPYQAVVAKEEFL